MPVYAFRCAACGDTDRRFSMSDVPAEVPCPHCGGTAPRRVSAGRLLRAGSTAGRLLETTARSAHEPSVVSAPPVAPTPQRVSRNPMHARLPRP